MNDFSWDLNQRPLACQASALPAELWNLEFIHLSLAEVFDDDFSLQGKREFEIVSGLNDENVAKHVAVCDVVSLYDASDCFCLCDCHFSTGLVL